MPLPAAQCSIDRLIAVVENGGKVRTGVDVRNKEGVLLLEKNVLVADPAILRKAKAQGAQLVPIVEQDEGGIWDKTGRRIVLSSDEGDAPPAKHTVPASIERRISEIVEVKKAAAVKYEQAKATIRQTLNAIQQTGGEFELEPVAATVSELFDFVSRNENAFAYLTREIFSYDDYLYNHSVNVCAIGTVVMQKFNAGFSAAINTFLNDHTSGTSGAAPRDELSFVYFTPEELLDISIGYFMHDLGKVLINPKVLNKPDKLTPEEFEEVKTHVTDKARLVLSRNRLTDPHIVEVCLYHHAALYAGEEHCYPNHDHRLVPAYAKVCKLADIYDAMTSRRCYKEALNPVGVVTDIFYHYARKDPLLQYLLHAFIKSVGIYPAGSVITLSNGQLAYVLDSNGPVLLPVTDPSGAPLSRASEMVVMGRGGNAPPTLTIDRDRPLVCPLDAYSILPAYLRRTIEADAESG